jgi:hypothetical protein
MSKMRQEARTAARREEIQFVQSTTTSSCLMGNRTEMRVLKNMNVTGKLQIILMAATGFSWYLFTENKRILNRERGVEKALGLGSNRS